MEAKLPQAPDYAAMLGPTAAPMGAAAGGPPPAVALRDLWIFDVAACAWRAPALPGGGGCVPAAREEASVAPLPGGRAIFSSGASRLADRNGRWDEAGAARRFLNFLRSHSVPPNCRLQR